MRARPCTVFRDGARADRVATMPAVAAVAATATTAATDTPDSAVGTTTTSCHEHHHCLVASSPVEIGGIETRPLWGSRVLLLNCLLSA